LKKKLTAVVAAMLCCFNLCSCSVNVEYFEDTEETYEADSDFDVNAIDPGDDFYGYINAADLMETELEAAAESTGTFDGNISLVDDEIDEMISDIVAEDPGYAADSPERLIYDLYHLVYDTYRGDAPVADYSGKTDEFVKMVDDCKTMDELLEVWAWQVREYGNYAQFLPSVVFNIYDSEEAVVNFQGILEYDGLNENDSTAALTRDDVAVSLQKTGVPEEEAKARATDVVYMYMEIEAHTDKEQLEASFKTGDPEKCFFEYSEEEFNKNSPDFSYADLLWLIDLEEYEGGKVYIDVPGQFFEITSLLSDEYLQEWKDHTIYDYLKSMDFCTQDDFKDLSAEECEERAVNTVYNFLGDELSVCYLERMFDKEVGEDITAMCEDIIAAYREMIEETDMYSQEGKEFLIKKLDNMEVIVGGAVPHGSRFKGEYPITDEINETKINLEKSVGEQNKYYLLNGWDRNEIINGMMKSYETNACYNPAWNNFIITAAMLKESFYDKDASYEQNLGMIGDVIAHEISHAFDNDGIKYDENGNYRENLLSESDVKKFEELQERTIEYYNGFTVLGNLPVDGENTLGENLADISAMQCILKIAARNGDTKEVLESYARLWETLMTDEYQKKLIDEDSHSPAPVRVNAVVACFDEFYEIYDVGEDDGLYVSPDSRIRRW